MKLDIRFLCKAVQGSIINGDPNISFSGVSTDSRSVLPGQVFFALEGKKHDGHQYVNQAFSRGAAAAVVSKVGNKYKEQPLILVSDTIHALQQLAKDYRSLFNIPLAAVTGSVGKTTTKEILAQCLESTYVTLKTQGSFNNEIGLPLTLLNLKEYHQIGVVELGMRGLGEIRTLAEVAQPTVAIITNVEPVHLETMGSLEKIAQAKCEVLSVLSGGSFAVINGDNTLLLAEADKYDCVKYTFGYNESCDFHIEKVTVRQEMMEIRADFRGQEELLNFPLPAASLALDVVAAASVCYLLGLNMAKVKQALLDYKPSGNRLNISTSKTGRVLINDTYNANPLSMSAALEVGLKLRKQGQFIAVLGDMFELGSYEKEGHILVGKKAAEIGVDLLITIGERARQIGEGAKSAGMAADKVKCFPDKTAALDCIKQSAKPGDTILFKASRGMELEKVIDELDF